jgi:HSP20 family protein
MNLIRYSPSNWFDAVLSRMLEDAVPATPAATRAESVFVPRVDIRDEKDVITVAAELPGVERDQLSVKVENGVLTLSGQKKQESETQENGFYRSECVYGTFQRSFTVPDTVDTEKIDAEYKDGVLKVWLHKKPEAAPKLISIRGEGKAAKEIGVS